MNRLGFLSLLVVAVLAAAAAPVGAIRHDSACRPTGFTGTDAPNSWTYADPLGSFDCVGEMHPTAGGPSGLAFADDHDWYYVNVGATSKTISVAICPIFVFVTGWNPDLNVYFLPNGGSLPASNPSTGQTLQTLEPLLGLIPFPPTLGVGSSANASGCDSVVNAGGADTAGGRFYIEVVRTGGGGGYSFQTSLQ